MRKKDESTLATLPPQAFKSQLSPTIREHAICSKQSYISFFSEPSAPLDAGVARVPRALAPPHTYVLPIGTSSGRGPVKDLAIIARRLKRFSAGTYIYIYAMKPPLVSRYCAMSWPPRRRSLTTAEYLQACFPGVLGDCIVRCKRLPLQCLGYRITQSIPA